MKNKLSFNSMILKSNSAIKFSGKTTTMSILSGNFGHKINFKMELYRIKL